MNDYMLNCIFIYSQDQFVTSKKSVPF